MFEKVRMKQTQISLTIVFIERSEHHCLCGDFLVHRVHHFVDCLRAILLRNTVHRCNTFLCINYLRFSRAEILVLLDLFDRKC